MLKIFQKGFHLGITVENVGIVLVFLIWRVYRKLLIFLGFDC